MPRSSEPWVSSNLADTATILHACSRPTRLFYVSLALTPSHHIILERPRIKSVFLVFSFSCPVPRETQPVNAGGRRLSRVAAAAFSGATGAVLGGVRADGHGLPKPGTEGCFLLRLVGCSACTFGAPVLSLFFFSFFFSFSLPLLGGFYFYAQVDTLRLRY